MSARRRRRGRVAVLTVIGAAAAGSCVWQAPVVLREMDMFQVRSVEVHGTRFLEPYTVVQAAGLVPGSNLFDDARDWRAGASSLPLVEEARVRRSLPGTVVIEVRESAPVALLAGGALRPVAADGRILAIEPAGAVLDLPILVDGAAREESGVSRAGLSALRVLVSLATEQGELADRVSQVEATDRWLRLDFRGDAPEALLPVEPTASQLVQLGLAFADLSARGELRSARRIDVRFRDQVVVSFQPRPVS